MFFIGLVNSNNAQVSSVKYLIEYNESNSLYDCKLVIEEGDATTILQRIQFTAQYSVVVPTGAQLSIQERYNPIQNNQNYGGTIPGKWQDNSPEISPPSQPQNDFYSIVPVLSPVSSYNNLFAGDTVTLFSISVDVDPSDNSVRPFINGVDPSSMEMPNGGDFSNGFAVGSTEDIYNDNLSICDFIAEFTGDDRLCIGETSTVSPSTGGTWVSNNSSVATISSATGVITAVAQGAVTFTFTDANTGCTATTTGLIVDSNPSVSTSMNSICLSSSAMLSPSNGGTWEAMNPGIATLSDNIVSAVSIGEAGFVFTSDATGCKSNILYINVEDLPVTTVTGPNEICAGSSSVIEPHTGGTWSSSDPSIATIDNFGNITGITGGCVTFTYTSGSTLCVSEPSEPVCVLPAPTVEIPYTDICLGGTMSLSPSTGGTWISSNDLIATVNSLTGEVTTFNSGTVDFTFISAETGCSSWSETITVHHDLFDEADDPIELCIGETSIGFPILEGNWVSDNPSAISVDFESGSITALSGGTALLSFTSEATGCSSELAVIAHNIPVVSIMENEICVGFHTAVTPITGGTWTANDPFHATVDNLGNVTGLTEGTTMLVFTDSATGCSSEPLMITVNAAPQASITGDKQICGGGISSAFPTTGGTWTSDDPAVATIDNAGIITGLNEGIVSFTFSDGQCTSTTEDIIVLTPYSIEIDTTICEGMNYNGLEESGIYTLDSFDVITGCDIITTIDLEVLPLSDPSCIVGIDNLLHSEIKVYPNPTNGLVFVESESALESISIYTIDYQKIEKLTFINEIKKTQINTDKLVKGLYILAIKSRGMLTYKKLIIE